ncbi:hypothetical protein [Streptomyces sp. NPDC001594]|uniref:hypothetical protein n=1 Tax=Streptomyces sp. NPDC001594 TaxID=3364590 RepID=UPI003699EFBB
MVLGATAPAGAETPTHAHAAGPALLQAVALLPVEAERREGCNQLREFGDRIDADKDGCTTRAEVLIEEAVEARRVGAKCKIRAASAASIVEPQDSPRSNR